MEEQKKRRSRNLTVNRRVSHDYFILEKHEAGIELVGTEVKVVRNGEAGLKGAWINVENNELMLHQLTIPAYAFGNRFNHNTLRTRRLLMHKREIRKLRVATEQKGLSLIPLRLYLTKNGRVKVEIGVCRGKAQHDKRETIKKREADIEARRSISSHYRG